MESKDVDRVAGILRGLFYFDFLLGEPFGVTGAEDDASEVFREGFGYRDAYAWTGKSSVV